MKLIARTKKVVKDKESKDTSEESKEGQNILNNEKKNDEILKNAGEDGKSK